MSSTTAAASSGTATEDQSWIAVAVISSILSLTTVIVGLRIYTRIFLLKQLGWDDFCVVITMVRCTRPHEEFQMNMVADLTYRSSPLSMVVVSCQVSRSTLQGL